MLRRLLDTADAAVDGAVVVVVAGAVGVAGFLKSCSEWQMAAALGRHTSFYAYYSAMAIVVVRGVLLVLLPAVLLVTRVTLVGKQRQRRDDVCRSR